MPETHTAPRPVILVVEDLESLPLTIQRILRGADFLVRFASNATEALEMAQPMPDSIHLLITKLHLDGMLGPDLAFRLRMRSPKHECPIQLRESSGGLGDSRPAEVVSSMLPRPFRSATLTSPDQCTSREEHLIAIWTRWSNASLAPTRRSSWPTLPRPESA
jgi:CheY-like chemotaxis protein